ncbi:MAG: NYN domain-containing protein [Patescibacteria group bacterium]|nr:NYN domain-containing protein [Patescibacteria group bacterium]MDD4304016.1 NYN domain-containing protein [Patescibacteria group bacterium]MDD4694893.1 NYN domain-containing protein [Patescibacteria group bacterium]
MNNKRVAVFIDNSNVFGNMRDLKKSGINWVCLYDPEFLAKKLAGNRELVYTGFYCTRPPAYLLKGNNDEKYKFNTANKYYSEIEKNPSVSVKYGDLKGTRGNLIEKNLDTQISSDMVEMAAFDKYDIAIIVSNDGDYKSAIESTKKFNKKIEVLFFQGSLSMSLRSVSDITRRARCSYFVKLDGM